MVRMRKSRMGTAASPPTRPGGGVEPGLQAGVVIEVDEDDPLVAAGGGRGKISVVW